MADNPFPTSSGYSHAPADRARYALDLLLRSNPLASVNQERRYWDHVELDAARLATDVLHASWLPPLQLMARLALELWADATGGARPEPALTVAELCNPTVDWVTGGVLLRAVAVRGGYVEVDLRPAFSAIADGR